MNTIEICVMTTSPCILTPNFTQDLLEVKYDPTRYEITSNPQVIFFYGQEGKFWGVRLPSTTTKTVKFGYMSSQQVLEPLTSDTTWTLKLDNIGIVTVVSPTNVPYSYLFTELSGDISAARIGFNDFDTSVSNCYRVFNPNQMTGIGWCDKCHEASAFISQHFLILN